MSDRTTKIKDIDRGLNAKGEKKVFRITIGYRLGGINFFTGVSSPRGYYMSVQPTTIGNGFSSFIGFTGISELLETSNRFSQKKLDTVEKSVLDGNHDEVMTKLLNATIGLCAKRYPSFLENEQVTA
jgi:hypothetical protein